MPNSLRITIHILKDFLIKDFLCQIFCCLGAFLTEDETIKFTGVNRSAPQGCTRYDTWGNKNTSYQLPADALSFPGFFTCGSLEEHHRKASFDFSHKAAFWLFLSPDL